MRRGGKKAEEGKIFPAHFSLPPLPRPYYLNAWNAGLETSILAVLREFLFLPVFSSFTIRSFLLILFAFLSFFLLSLSGLARTSVSKFDGPVLVSPRVTHGNP